MPRFKDEENPALNSFRRINAEVVKRRKKKYALQEEAPSTTRGETTGQFDNLRQRLVEMNVSLTDLSQTIKLSGSASSPSTVIDRFVSIASNLSGQVSNTRDFFVRQLKRSFNSFSDDEITEVASLIRSLREKLFVSIDTLQTRAVNPRGREALRTFAVNSIQVLMSFAEQLNSLLNMMDDAVKSYKQSGVGAGRNRVIKCGGMHTLPFNPINALPFPRLNDQMYPITTLPYPRQPIRRIGEIPDARFFRKIGGAELYSQEPVLKGGATAYRTGLNFGNKFTDLGPYPPRNTQDLKDLPRRFL